MLPPRLFGALRPAWRSTQILSRSYPVRLPQRLVVSRPSSSGASFVKSEPHAPETKDRIRTDAAEPRLAIAFTCTADGCNHRSAHTFTKRAYERGIVIVQCPGCKNRHLVADNLGWFKDDTKDGQLKNIEDILRARGDHVQRGTLDADGVVEVSDG